MKTIIRIVAEHYTEDGFLAHFNQIKLDEAVFKAMADSIMHVFPSDFEISESARIIEFLQESKKGPIHENPS